MQYNPPKYFSLSLSLSLSLSFFFSLSLSLTLFFFTLFRFRSLSFPLSLVFLVISLSITCFSRWKILSYCFSKPFPWWISDRPCYNYSSFHFSFCSLTLFFKVCTFFQKYQNVFIRGKWYECHMNILCQRFAAYSILVWMKRVNVLILELHFPPPTRNDHKDFLLWFTSYSTIS